MDLSDYKYLIIALVIGVFLGWWFFRNGSTPEFVGLGPLLNQVTEVVKGRIDEDEAEEEEEPRKVFKVPKARPTDFKVPKASSKAPPKAPDAPPPQRAGIFTSKGEIECTSAATEVFGVPFHKVNPKWLTNPKTGRRLQIDCYNDELKIGVEYNGKQHYVYPNGIHKSKQEFDDQQERDRVKLDLCDKNGVYLITIPYTVPICDIKEYITYYHPDRRAERLMNGETRSATTSR